jgi:hypothetical protein
MPASRVNGNTAVTMRVPLDSTYLFERGPDGRYRGPPGIAAPAGHAPEVELRPYDNVLILPQPDWLLPRIVALRGEVRYPGDYTLRSKSETLADVIQRAGGLTRDAYPAGVVFTRTRGSVGRIGIDLPAILKDPAHPDNLIMSEGDVVEIPVFSGVVTVAGSVNSPVALAYLPGADVEYYIRAAGGGSANADVASAYVTQPSGKVEVSRRHLHLWTSHPVPQPGSTITVPAQQPGSALADVMAGLNWTSSLLTSLVAIIAILKR